VKNADGSTKHPGLDNHGMGTVFEELVRRFNEENNEEAGEHWTPRDAVKLMAKLIFLPIANEIESGTYLLYDGACGTGGMLTVAEETLQQLAGEHGRQVATHLYGQEINAETYAICKADLLLKGEGDAVDNIIGGPEHSTLANDAFPSREFDFMLSNPPYGKSWKSDLERMGGKGGIKDPRFIIEQAGDPEYSLITRSSDGQMLFLANMLSKMKQTSRLGSRIAEVHNGSSLFTGDAGQVKATSAAGSSKTTGSKPSSRCRSTCSITPVSRPTSGCSPTANPPTARVEYSSSMPRSGSSRSARTLARRTANCPKRTSNASATPLSPLRKQSNRRFSRTLRSVIGR
jgi:type I restriction-modification system DNA methylase subunit